jgi:hypothetical protein
MPTRLSKTVTALDGVTTTGASAAIDVAQYRHILVSIATSGSANATIKFAGSFEEEAPAFGTAASATNVWDFIAAYNLEDPSSITDGDTGVVYSGTDAVEQYIVNTDGLKWFAANVTARSAGTITVKVVGFDNT